jgi:hypothetical protein
VWTTRTVAARVRRLLFNPTYESVTRNDVYDSISANQQRLINEAKQARHGWYTKTHYLTVDGAQEEYTLAPADFGGIYSVSYNRTAYPNQSFPDIQVLGPDELEHYDTVVASTPTPGSLAMVATRYDADLGQEVLMVRPRNVYAELVIEYAPGALDPQAPSDRPQIVGAATPTLLPTMVAGELVAGAEWDTRDPGTWDGLRDRLMRQFAGQFEFDWRQFTRNIHMPHQSQKMITVRPFGRGGSI